MPLETKEIPEEIQGLTPEAFNQWKSHPVTKALRLWFQECREVLREDHLRRWEERRELPDHGEIEASVKADMFRELHDLEAVHILRTFYDDDQLTPEGQIIKDEEKDDQ